jgi:hypothetical protein
MFSTTKTQVVDEVKIIGQRTVYNVKWAELSNLSLKESFSLFAPMESDGAELKPSKCYMYNVNYTHVLEVNSFFKLNLTFQLVV